MNTLYIIGNGFDKAHGLNTDYWDFRTYLESYHPDFLIEFEKIYGVQYIDYSEYGYSDYMQKQWESTVYNQLWSTFELSMGSPDIDYMKSISTSVLNDLNLETGNVGIRDTMDMYWKSEFGFIKKLQGYVKEWIKKIDTINISPRKKDLVDANDDFFLNFNYTDVLENVYKIDNVMHIHGSCLDYDIDPFMGHCNEADIKRHRLWEKEADELWEEGEASIQQAIADYLNEIHKDTSHYIALNRSFFDSLGSVTKVIVIGWAAGEVDIPYLTMIKKSVSTNTEWVVYYYNKTAQNDLHAAFKRNGILDNFKVSFEKSEQFWDY